jgi:hypothetical protein
LLDANGQAISDSLGFNTSANCQENLVMFNFSERREP